MREDLWTTEEDIRLCKYVADGRPSSYAASKFPNHTRNACIGRAGRLGIKFASREPIKPKVVVKPKPEPRPAPEPIPSNTMEIFVGVGVALEDAASGACRFPYEGHPQPRCCGEPITIGKSYCLQHYELCTPKGRKTEDGKTTFGHRCPHCLKEYLDAKGLGRHQERSYFCGRVKTHG